MQSKNCIIIATCTQWILDTPRDVQSIELIYPVTGHLFIPSDRILDSTELVLKTKVVIISSYEYVQNFIQFGWILV